MLSVFSFCLAAVSCLHLIATSLTFLFPWSAKGSCGFFVVCGAQRSAKGQEVFDKVCQHLTLANNEKEYFACSFRDEKKTRVSFCCGILSCSFCNSNTCSCICCCCSSVWFG